MQVAFNHARQGQPLAVGFLTSSEPINAPARAERGSPGIVPNKAKSTLADRATFADTLMKKLEIVAHFSSSPPYTHGGGLLSCSPSRVAHGQPLGVLSKPTAVCLDVGIAVMLVVRN